MARLPTKFQAIRATITWWTTNIWTSPIRCSACLAHPCLKRHFHYPVFSLQPLVTQLSPQDTSFLSCVDLRTQSCIWNHMLMRCLQQSTEIFPLSLRIWKNECEWFMQWWIKLSEFCKSRTSDAIPMPIFIWSLSPHKATHLICKQHFASHIYVKMSFWVIQRIQSCAEKTRSMKKIFS